MQVPVTDLHAAYGPNMTPALYIAGLGTQLSTVQYLSACKSNACTVINVMLKIACHHVECCVQ